MFMSVLYDGKKIMERQIQIQIEMPSVEMRSTSVSIHPSVCHETI